MGYANYWANYFLTQYYDGQDVGFGYLTTKVYRYILSYDNIKKTILQSENIIISNSIYNH